MREIRQSGSEGGGGSIPLPTPIGSDRSGTASRSAMIFRNCDAPGENADLDRWPRAKGPCIN